MFDRFTDDAKKSMSQTRLAALRLQHDCIDAGHLLLGLLAGPSTAARTIDDLGADRTNLAADLERRLGIGPQPVTAGQLPFTPAAKHCLELTLAAATELGDQHVGTGHLLLGLLVHGGIAGEALGAHGITAARVKASLTVPGSGYGSTRTCDDGLLDATPPADRHDPAAVERRRLLLVSNSTMHGGGYLAHCTAEIRDFLGPRQRVLFVPYALADHDGYAAKARAAFAAFGHDLISAHEGGDPRAQLAAATAVFVGGGNTFRLLDRLYHTRLLPAIRRRVDQGMPYLGSSAGTNVATLSIRTTNDMPIVMPPSFAALTLVPFQINPHFLDPDPHSTHMGETREERLRQFHEESDVPVLGLREGCLLRVEGRHMELRGTTRARLFRRGRAPEEFTPPCDLSFLLLHSPA
jgi:dipeptidase E